MMVDKRLRFLGQSPDFEFEQLDGRTNPSLKLRYGPSTRALSAFSFVDGA